MFYLNDKFKKVLSPAKWRNLVSAFLNNLSGDGIVEVNRPDKPSATNPPSISLNIPKLERSLGLDGIRPVPYQAFEMRSTQTVDSSGNITATTFKVYLPTLSALVRVNEFFYSITGCTAVSNESGWYTTGLTIGTSGTVNIYLVDDSPTKARTVKFSTSSANRFGVLVAQVVNGVIKQYHIGSLFMGTDVLTAFQARMATVSSANVIQVYLPSTTVGRINGVSKTIGTAGWYNTGIAAGNNVFLNEDTDGNIAFATSAGTNKRRMSLKIAYVSANGMVSQYFTGFFDYRNNIMDDTDTNQVTVDPTTASASAAWTRNSATGNLVVTVPVTITDDAGGVAGKVTLRTAQMVFGPDGRLKSIGASSAVVDLVDWAAFADE